MNIKNFLVFDTETTNNFANPLIYDFGGIIANRQGEVLHKFNFIFPEVFYYGQGALMQSAFYKSKIPMYNKMIENNEITVLPFPHVLNYLKEITQEYKIKEAYAYNMDFDARALNATSKYLTGKAFSFKKIQPYCIYNFSAHTLCNSRNYVKFCVENGLFTQSGKYISTTAETVYKYITGNMDFVEEHTALNDALIEYEILLKCFGRHRKQIKDVRKNIYTIPQRAFKKFCHLYM